VHVLEAGAQILNPDGSTYSFPILWGEAGIYRDSNGQPYANVEPTVRDLPHVELVKAERYDGATPDDPTDGGATWSYGDWTQAKPGEATHALIGLATYSDYSGGVCERSNHRSLRRDHPDTFVDVYGGHGTRALLLPVDKPAGWHADDDDNGADRWQGLLEDLAKLADYPLYDEEDLCALELELADEAWKAYLRHDVTRDLRAAGVPDDAVADEARLRERFYTLTYEADYGPEAESAVDVHFPFYDATVAALARELGATS
jgi:hypothetical protein